MTTTREVLESGDLTSDRESMDAVVRKGVSADTLTTDGSADYTIEFAAESPDLEGRRHLYSPLEDMPQVVYLGGETSESELLERCGHVI